MKSLQPFVLIENQDWPRILRRIELKGRTCYKSEDAITTDSAGQFVEHIANLGHLSVIEHEKISVLFTVDRGITHELVRHRLASFSQESTRYCNYTKGKFGNEISVIDPFFFFWNEDRLAVWTKAMKFSEKCYNELIALGATPQEARSVLPNSLKSDIWMTANLREWKTVLSQRASKAAHPQMKQVAIPLLLKLKKLLPPIFGPVNYDEAFSPQNYAKINLSEVD